MGVWEVERERIAKLAIERAGDWLKGAESAYKDGRWNDVVYCSQMCVEQSVKAVLLLFKIDYPKEHDVSGIFMETVERLDVPSWFRKEARNIARKLSELSNLRGLAGYGFEKGVGRDFFKDYAPEALESARKIHDLCKKLLGSR